MDQFDGPDFKYSGVLVSPKRSMYPYTIPVSECNKTWIWDEHNRKYVSITIREQIIKSNPDLD